LIVVDGGGGGRRIQRNSLASELGVEGDDDGVLLLGEAAVPDVGAEVIEPPQPAALAAPLQSCDHTRRTRRDQSTNTRACWYGRISEKRRLLSWLTGFLGQGDPVAAAAVALDVAAQRLVLLRRPRAPLHGRPVAARRPSHGRRSPPTQVPRSDPAARRGEEKHRRRKTGQGNWLLCREQVVLVPVVRSFVGGHGAGDWIGLDPLYSLS
jgi:hypothetical protein